MNERQSSRRPVRWTAHCTAHCTVRWTFHDGQKRHRQRRDAAVALALVLVLILAVGTFSISIGRGEVNVRRQEQQRQRTLVLQSAIESVVEMGTRPDTPIRLPLNDSFTDWVMVEIVDQTGSPEAKSPETGSPETGSPETGSIVTNDDNLNLADADTDAARKTSAGYYRATIVRGGVAGDPMVRRFDSLP